MVEETPPPGRPGDEPDTAKQPVFFWVVVLLAGIYVAVRLVEGALCVAAWLGWGSCPWSG